MHGLNRLAEILSGSERHFLARLDLDCFAGGGIASHAGGALAHLKGSEPGDADPRAFLEVLPNQSDGTGQHLVRLFCRNPMRFANRGCELAKRDKLHFHGFGGFLACGGCFGRGRGFRCGCGFTRGYVLAVVADFVFAIDLSLHCAGLPNVRLTTGAPVDAIPGLTGCWRYLTSAEILLICAALA